MKNNKFWYLKLIAFIKLLALAATHILLLATTGIIVGNTQYSGIAVLFGQDVAGGHIFNSSLAIFGWILLLIFSLIIFISADYSKFLSRKFASPFLLVLYYLGFITGIGLVISGIILINCTNSFCEHNNLINSGSLGTGWIIAIIFIFIAGAIDIFQHFVLTFIFKKLAKR